jgi:hypothetical protein
VCAFAYADIVPMRAFAYAGIVPMRAFAYADIVTRVRFCLCGHSHVRLGPHSHVRQGSLCLCVSLA